MHPIILSTAYFAPISYFSVLQNAESVNVEQFENFGKQSYRNRCEIMTTNGVVALTVPVEKANSKTLIKDLKISYATEWQKIHFRSIESAYRNSPYYDYYIDDFISFFESKEKYLFDLNHKITNQVLECLNINKELNNTTDYIHNVNTDVLDFRNSFHPKRTRIVNPLEFSYKEYRQTFSERIDFASDLSILDLIFCCGPDSCPMSDARLISTL